MSLGGLPTPLGCSLGHSSDIAGRLGSVYSSGDLLGRHQSILQGITDWEQGKNGYLSDGGRLVLNYLSYLFYLCRELVLIDVGRPYHLATLCVPEDSIVVTTTFLPTWLTCVDCYLYKRERLY
jgi:hypothetical protein